ncbi:hypothetical protein CBR_g31812 [Chara braunii]|uniref:Uncharacterized protein n=1 Tax=Chara braunii TaxID=69332 RepID=A0A388LFQ0_CHABU|nr:hypothetical protein CBR_g31812 [Chara braunii]|eukprot:GBG81136.1 hypothetical protein CBR_g31812 [Chara braunii]
MSPPSRPRRYVRRNGTEFRMLPADQFLSKTNGYRVTGSLPVVDNTFMISRPLVPFNSPTEQLATFVMRYREQFAGLPAAQQVDCVFVPFAAVSKRRQDQPAKTVARRKQVTSGPRPSDAVVQALPAQVPPSVRQSLNAAEQSSETTDLDDGALRYRADPQHRPHGGADASADKECEGRDGEGRGWEGEGGGEGDDGNEGDAEGEEDDMDEERYDVGEDDTCRNADDVVDVRGQPTTSRGMSQSCDQAKGGREELGSRGKRRRKEASTSPAGRKQARADAVNEARGALTASQKARAPRKAGGGGGGECRGGGHDGGRKGSQKSRASELRDSGDEGEGVGPRMPEDVEELGFARQDVHVVNVDVTRIKRIPRGRILFNHFALSENIVRGIESVIESSIGADPGAWDRPELVLASVDPNVIVGGQGRRITPEEFLQRDSAEFDWYAVCGQHTAEAMKRLVSKDSPTVKVYSLRTYSKVRVVYLDDDHTRGYFNVSAFDNTRENCAMMLSFRDAVRDMRQWWIDNQRIEAPKSKVSEKDPVAVAHQKTWQNFLRACMGKACDKAFVKQALENEYNKDWSNKLHGYLNLATSTNTVLPLVEKFFAMFGEVPPPRVNTECLLDILRKERYMVRMFNYVVFRSDGRQEDEWNDDFFMSYKDLEERYASNGLCVAEWEKQREKLHSSLVKTIPRRLGGVEEARQGVGLGPTEVMYKEVPFHFKVFVYTTIDKLDMLRAEVKRIASSARHLVWDELGRQITLLPVCMRTKEVMAAPDDIVAAAQKMTCRAAIVDISAANFNNAWTSQDFDALYAMMAKCCGPNWVLFFFAPQKVESDVLRQLYHWENIELIPGSWTREDRPSSDVTRYDNIATTSRDLMTIVLHVEGGDLKKVTVAPRLLNDLTEVHVVEKKFRKCQGKHGGDEGDETATYSIWERESGKLQKLCSSFVGEAEGVLLLGRAHAGLIWKLLLAGNNVIVCDESAKDIAYLTKFIDILVKDGRFKCRLENPRATYRTNRDMYHKLGPKRLKVWEYLFRNAPEGRLDGGYIYRKAKVTEHLKHYHGAITGAFETFVARCEILRFDLHKDQLTFKDYVDLAKSGEGFNLVDSEEDSSDSDLEIENDTTATGWRGQSAAMEHGVTGYEHGQSKGCSNLPPAHSVASGVDRVECTPMEDDEDEDLDIPAQPTKLAPGDPIPPSFCVDPNTMYFLDDKCARTSEDKWGHDIIWHDGIFEPCIQGGQWKMAVKYVSKGWKPFPRMAKNSWLKKTEQSILYRCRKENLGESETFIAAKAKQLFDALGANRHLEYSHKFYELHSSPSYGMIDWKVERTTAFESMDVDTREQAAPVVEAATGNTMGQQREDGGTTLGVKAPLPEAGKTPAGKNTTRAISVAMGETSQGENVSLAKPANAGVAYGSLLATRAALAGTSEMESESTSGMTGTGMSLHPPTCTTTGDAHCTTTPQGGVTRDDGNGGKAGGSPHLRNIEDMNTDDEDEVEGRKGVSDPTCVGNEG